MATLLLPEMTAAFGEEASGVWLGMPVTALSDFADFLAIDETLPNPPTYNCLPDVWAQLLQFELDLLGTGPLATDAKCIWRALLTLWAISRDSQLPVTTLQISGFARGHFLRAAGRLKPTATLLAGDHWNAIGIVRFDGEPIAILNPATLIAPTAECRRVLAARFPSWFANGRLCDPLYANVLTPRQKILVREAVRYLFDEINRRRATSGYGAMQNRAIQLMQLLADFGNELVEHAVGELSVLREQSSQVFGANQIIQALENTFRIQSSSTPMRWLPVRPELNATGIKGLIIADSNLARTLGMQPEEVALWEGISLAQALADPAVFNATRAAAASAGYLIATVDELFTPNLCALSSRTRGDVQMPAHSASAQKYVLPVQAMLLAFMDARTLAGSIDVVETADGALVRLRVSLQGADGEGVAHTIVRQFDRVISDEQKPNACGVWPDFISEKWHAYFLVTDFQQGRQLAPGTAFYVGAIAAALAEAQSLAEKALGLRSLNDALTRGSTRRLVGPTLDTPAQLQRQVWLQALSKPPEAILCNADIQARTVHGRADSDVQTMGPVGLVLMPSDETTPNFQGKRFHRETNNDRRWVVGIDFGTTNTSIYCTKGNAEPEALRFSKRLVSPFGAEAENDDLADQTQINFGITGKSLLGVFQTIQQSRPTRSGLSEADRLAWGGAGLRSAVWAHRIMFNSNAILNLGALQDRPADIVFGDRLKWGIGLPTEEAADLKIRVAAFLRQCVLQSLAEAAAEGVPPDRVTFRFSYPGAFGPNTADTFKAICEEAVGEVTGDLAPRGLRVENAPLQTNEFADGAESRCAALYFLKVHNAFMGQPLALFDIGGGTTDMAIIRRAKVLTHCSLRFAGRDAFLAPLLKSDLVRTALAAQGNLDNIAARFNAIDEKSSALEVVINAPELLPGHPGGADLIRAIASGPEANVAWLKGLVTLAYSGLVYFAGAALAGSVDAATKEEIEKETIRLCFGGRGSLMFNAFVPETVRNAAGRIFQLGAELEEGAVRQPIFSERPKEEVAYGLVARQDAVTTWDDSHAHLPPLGEAVLSGHRTVPPGETYRALVAGSDWRIDPALPGFQRFLQIFREQTGATVTFEPDVWREIADGANDGIEGFNAQVTSLQRELGDTGTSAPEGSLLAKRIEAVLRARQPPFILVLREAIEILVRFGPKGETAGTKISIGR